MSDTEIESAAARLERVLIEMGSVAVALSGGVDSLVLTAVAHELEQNNRLVSLQIFHAVSPAVQEEATERVRQLSVLHDWHVEIINAGEFEDPRYVANPVDRCFYCKSSLYGTISALTKSIIVSGTNTDDLSDYRPGLEAAKTFSVRHPYVEANIDKGTIRQLAGRYKLADYADLPAAPCLSSRVETGIEIDSSELRSINRIEQLLGGMMPLQTVRCRLRSNAVSIEVDEDALSKVELVEDLDTKIRAHLTGRYASFPIQFSAYKMGSAFLRPN